MFSQLIAKNKFGATTWTIKLMDTTFIYIHETNDNSYLIELKEFNWFYLFSFKSEYPFFKTVFSYISKKNFENVIIESIEVIYEKLKYRKNILKFLIPKEILTNEILSLLRSPDFKKI